MERFSLSRNRFSQGLLKFQHPLSLLSFDWYYHQGILSFRYCHTFISTKWKSKVKSSKHLFEAFQELPYQFSFPWLWLSMIRLSGKLLSIQSKLNVHDTMSNHPYCEKFDLKFQEDKVAVGTEQHNVKVYDIETVSSFL